MRKIVAIALWILATRMSWADVVVGRVVGITDGHSLTLLGTGSGNLPHRIRLAGIDAPDLTQPFGNHSKSALGALTFGKDVQAECGGKRDPYGQEECKLRLNGTDINLEQIRSGMAWWYRPRAGDQSAEDQADYEQAEFQAKIYRTGLWADKNPVAPWIWRREK
jgi:endonuclease YncB( thermonuclease family)